MARKQIGRVFAIVQDSVCLEFPGGDRHWYYFWEEIRHRTGAINNWYIYEEACEPLNTLERLAHEVSDV